MKAFLDTSVLVNAFQAEQPHHEASIDLLGQQKKSTGYTSAHCLAETYSALTRMPGKYRASSEQGLFIIRDICERLSLVALSETEYVEAVTGAAAAGISGGAIYDALVAQCALKAKAQVIYTWNAKHFMRLGPEIAKRVREPS